MSDTNNTDNTDNINNNNISGALNLNKPAGCSSHDMVYFTRRLFGLKRVGHTGTLDPMATGVLPVLIGGATKLSEILSDRDKSYRAILRLGLATDTMDITGNIISEAAENAPVPGIDEVKQAAAEFIGTIEQIPPVYSAIKLNGRKLYEYARDGIEIKPEPRVITIYSLTCESAGGPREYILDITCSKGAYIRSLCHDIGAKLKCGGVMAALERTRSGNFCISGAYTPEILESLKKDRGPEYLESLLISSEEILRGVTNKKIALSGFYEKLAKNGAEIYLHKIKPADDLRAGDKVLMYGENGALFALGEVRVYADGPACKPVIML